MRHHWVSMPVPVPPALHLPFLSDELRDEAGLLCLRIRLGFVEPNDEATADRLAELTALNEQARLRVEAERESARQQRLTSIAGELAASVVR